MNKYHKYVSHLFIVAGLITFSIGSHAIGFASCDYLSPNEYESGELDVKLKKDNGNYIYIFDDLAGSRGYIGDAPNQKLVNLDLWYRINNQDSDYDKQGPERPFRSLDVCMIKNGESEADVDVFYRENNEMVWIDVEHVMANDVCGAEYPVSGGSICDFYPNGKEDVFATTDDDVNDQSWTVFNSDRQRFDIPAVIQGIPVRMMVAGEEGERIGTNGGVAIYKDSTILVHGNGLLVPKWWVDEYNSTRDDYFEPYLSSHEWFVGEGATRFDHAGNEFKVEVEPRFEANVHYRFDGIYSNFSEEISIKPLTPNNELDLDLFQYNEFDICCDAWEQRVDATYQGDSESSYIHMLGSEIELIAAHSIKDKDNIEYKIGSEFIGGGFNTGLLSTLTDDTATTRDILRNYDYESQIGGGPVSNAWIWLWEDAVSLSAPVKISFSLAPIDPGDFNGDGCIDRSDLSGKLIPAIIAHSSDQAFDLNGDGEVNIVDARYLVRWLFSNPRGASCD